MKKGFTLIELLVVVLIIGILSAVALPQYQAAVLKSKIAELMINAKAMTDAAKLMYLETGEYPTDITTLPIEWKGTLESNATNGTNSRITFSNGNFCVLDIEDYWIRCGLLNSKIQIFHNLHPHTGTVWEGEILCYSNGEKVSDRVCASMGGTYNGEGSSGSKYWRLK